MDTKELIEACVAELEAIWAAVEVAARRNSLADAISDMDLHTAIQDSINAPTRTYRYVLPTQLLAKSVDASLDCRALQVAAGTKGAFDARTICHRVIVPFDRAHESVLGGSPEPYVNNPLRIPAITRQYEAQQQNKSGWALLCDVLDAVQLANDLEFTRAVFKQTLIEIHRRLTKVRVTYPTPQRISSERAAGLVADFLASQSGGDRAQAVASALFRAIGTTFGIYTDVRRSRTNAADIAAGQVADLECVAGDHIVLAVEVKDQPLTLRHVQDKVLTMRSLQVTELAFLALKGVEAQERPQIDALIAREFSSGQNIYVLDSFAQLFAVMLALLGESGRRTFLDAIGEELDRYGSDLSHRKAWQQLLLNET